VIETALKLLETGLSLWLHKEKTKYVDKLMDLKRKYYEEINRPADLRNDAVLDSLEFELCVLALAFTSSVGKPNAQDQPGLPGI
jgi:hypothetical protein